MESVITQDWKMPVETLNKTISYLYARPYREVSELITEITSKSMKIETTHEINEEWKSEEEEEVK